MVWRRLHRITELLSRMKYRDRGIWCGPRVVPVLWEGVFKKMPQKTTRYLRHNPLTLTRTPTLPIWTLSRKNQAFFFVGKNWSTTLKVIQQNILRFLYFILDNISVMRWRLPPRRGGRGVLIPVLQASKFETPVSYRPQKKSRFLEQIHDWKHLYLCIFLVLQVE